MQREKQGDTKAAVEREMLIKSLMYLLEKGGEMKYEDKIINMCHIQSHSLKTPLSTA